MSESLGDAVLDLRTDSKQYDAGLKKAQAGAGRFVKDTGAKFKALGSQLTSTGRSLTVGFTAPLLAVGVGSVKAYGDFDSAMNKSLAIMGEVSEAMRVDMADAALEVAKTTTFSADQAAESFFFLASAGLSAAQSIGALPQVAAFAQAGAFDMATATDLLTDAQSALGLSSDDTAENLLNMARVSDVLVKANTIANATVEQFSESLTSEAGAALKAFGIDMEEGVAVLAAFADQGVKGNKAGTDLSRILRLMTSAAVDNADAYKALGIEVFDASGEVNNLGEIIGQIEVGLGGMSDASRIAALEQLGFNARVQGAIMPLIGASASIKSYEADLRSAGGITKEVAENQLQTLWAQLGLVRDQVVAVAIELGATLAPVIQDTILPLLRQGIEVVEGVVGAFSNASEPVQLLVLAVGALAAAAGPLLIIFGTLASAAGSLSAAFGAAGLAGAVGSAGVAGSLVGALASGAAILTGPVGLVVAIGATVLAIPPLRQAIKNLIENEMWRWKKSIKDTVGALVEAHGWLKKHAESLPGHAAKLAKTRRIWDDMGQGVLTFSANMTPILRQVEIANKKLDEMSAAGHEVGFRYKEAGGEMVQYTTGLMGFVPVAEEVTATVEEGAAGVDTFTDSVFASEEAAEDWVVAWTAAYRTQTQETRAWLDETLETFAFAEIPIEVSFDPTFILLDPADSPEEALCKTIKAAAKEAEKCTDEAGKSIGGTLFGGLKNVFSSENVGATLARAFEGGGGLLGAVKSLGSQLGAVLSEGLGAGLSTIPVVGPFLAALAPLLIAGVTKILGGLFGGVSALEKSGRLAAAAVRAGLLEGLNEAQLAEVAAAVGRGMSQAGAAAHIAIRDAALASGASLAEAEAQATRLVEALWRAEKEGPEAVAAVQAEIDSYIASAEDASDATDAWADAVLRAEEAAKAAWESWAQSVGISNKEAERHNRAYFEDLADQLGLSGKLRKDFIQGNLDRNKEARQEERKANRKALQDEADDLGLNEHQKAKFVKAGLEKQKADRQAARQAERDARKAGRDEFKDEQKFQRDQIKRTMDSAIRWSNEVGVNWSAMIDGMTSDARQFEDDLVGNSIFPDTARAAIASFKMISDQSGDELRKLESVAQDTVPMTATIVAAAGGPAGSSIGSGPALFDASSNSSELRELQALRQEVAGLRQDMHTTIAREAELAAQYGALTS